jgi:hypothetical protein
MSARWKLSTCIPAECGTMRNRRSRIEGRIPIPEVGQTCKLLPDNDLYREFATPIPTSPSTSKPRPSTQSCSSGGLAFQLATDLRFGNDLTWPYNALLLEVADAGCGSVVGTLVVARERQAAEQPNRYVLLSLLAVCKVCVKLAETREDVATSDSVDSATYGATWANEISIPTSSTK